MRFEIVRIQKRRSYFHCDKCRTYRGKYYSTVWKKPVFSPKYKLAMYTPLIAHNNRKVNLKHAYRICDGFLMSLGGKYERQIRIKTKKVGNTLCKMRAVEIFINNIRSFVMRTYKRR